MLNLDQLKAGINNGNLDAVYKDCRRYGVITGQTDYDYRGDLMTTVCIDHKGLSFEFDLVRGEVVSAMF